MFTGPLFYDSRAEPAEDVLTTYTDWSTITVVQLYILVLPNNPKTSSALTE